MDTHHRASLDEQVVTLMQGTEYGDEDLKQAMAGELRQRLDRGTAGGPAAARLLRLRSTYDRPASRPYHYHA